MGWSMDGADQMGSLKVFKFNGGNVYEYITNKRKPEEKKARIDKLDPRIIKRSRKNVYETLNNITIINLGKISAATNFLKAVEDYKNNNTGKYIKFFFRQYIDTIRRSYIFAKSLFTRYNIITMPTRTLRWLLYLRGAKRRHLH